MEWIEPVYDRTQADITNKTPKAFMNTADFNRIENNCQVLADTMGVLILRKKWKDNTFVYAQDIQRIAIIVSLLRESGFVYSTTPPVPDLPYLTYQKWNDIEKILFDIHDILTKNTKEISYVSPLTYVESTIN